MLHGERIPSFIADPRAMYGEGYTPIDYLGGTDTLSYAMAAQWLFIPDFAVYRGGVFRTAFPMGLTERRRKNLDDWFDHYNGVRSRVEIMGNSLELWDALGIDDPIPLDQDLVDLGKTLASAWLAILESLFPDLSIRVEFEDDDDSGPKVSFSTEGADFESANSGIDDEKSPRRAKFPTFLESWKTEDGGPVTPISYLGNEDGAHAVIASRWLYVPNFFEYRGGVFRSALPEGISERQRGIIDDLFDNHGGDVSVVERAANRLVLEEVFGVGDPAAIRADLVQMAESIKHGWSVFVHKSFPGRRFRVESHDDERGRWVTFFSDGRS
jgi:hypothetical protein